MLAQLLSSVAPMVGAGISGLFNMAGSNANAAAMQQVNAANLQFATQQQTGAFLKNYLGNMVSAAGSAGLSPLAVLGVNPGSGPGAIVQSANPGEGMMRTGQDVSRAALAFADVQQKNAELDLATKRMQLAGMTNDVVAGQMRNSVTARTLAAPGTPLPTPDPRYEEDVKPMMQRVRGTEGVAVIPSGTVQQGLWSPIPGMPANPRVAYEIAQQNLANDPVIVRPDIGRQLLSWGNYLRGVPDYFLGQ